MISAEALLQKHWGFDRFRPFQKEIISSVLKGKDTLGLLPTGGGKSICYQIPALMKEGIVLVVSPLIALMQDQVAQLKQKKIPAMMLERPSLGQSPTDQLDNLDYGPYKILFVSP
jgi:ATP-dependent DNA helicase RecQ